MRITIIKTRNWYTSLGGCALQLLNGFKNVANSSLARVSVSRIGPKVRVEIFVVVGIFPNIDPGQSSAIVATKLFGKET